MIIVNGEAVGSGVPKGGLPTPQAEQPQPATQPPHVEPPEPVEPQQESEGPPKEYATKSDWVDWAVSRGADRDEAESLTKNELIELYGEESQDA